MGTEKALIWNVQGLNARQHRDTVHDLVVMEHPSLVCLQEIKLM
jgi:exonuclease III